MPETVKVVDLSADFRLFDPAAYQQWYGAEHKAQELQKSVAYGLTELHREAVAKARIVANPGCYPTPAQLALSPLLAEKRILAEDIIISAASGVSGAGRTPKEGTLFTEVSEGMHAYSIGGHRHAPEIEQGLSWAAGVPVRVNFTPHLVPMNRGIIESICIIPFSNGVLSYTRSQYRYLDRSELWDNYYTLAPARQRRCVETYKIVKRA